MKKRIYFLISAIAQIALGFLNFTILDTIIEAKVKAYNMVGQVGLVNLFTNYGKAVILGETIFGILVNLFVILLLKKDKYIKYKVWFIILFVLDILVTANILAVLFEIINIIVLISAKKTAESDTTKVEKKEIPKLEYKKSSKKEIILGIVMILTYFVLQFGVSFLVDVEKLDNNIQFIIRWGISIVLFILAIFIFKDTLKNDFKIFKENKKEYIKFIFSRFILFMLGFIVINSIVVSISGKQSTNQNLLQELLSIWEMIILAVFWAPVVEEMVFRGAIRRFIKNDILFIIISGLSFGFIHVVSEPTLSELLINLIPYSFMGGFFAYMYAKSKNICTNMICHATWNTISACVSLLSFVLQ